MDLLPSDLLVVMRQCQNIKRCRKFIDMLPLLPHGSTRLQHDLECLRNFIPAPGHFILLIIAQTRCALTTFSTISDPSNSRLMHCFINWPRVHSRPNNPSPGTAEHFILSWVHCAIFAAFPIFSCSQYFSLVDVYSLLITADKQCVVYTFDKKTWRKNTNLPRYNPSIKRFSTLLRGVLFYYLKVLDSTPGLFPFFMTSKAS